MTTLISTRKEREEDKEEAAAARAAAASLAASFAAAKPAGVARSGAEDWVRCNQIYLSAALERIAAALRNHGLSSRQAAGADTVPPAAQERTLTEQEPNPKALPEMPPPPLRAVTSPPPALVTICRLFGLSPFERDILTLCAGVELAGAIAELCATAQPGRPYPTFGLALAAFPGAHWSALTPDAPLRRWQLIELPGANGGRQPDALGAPLTQSALRIDERILHYLVGVDCSDPRLEGMLRMLSSDAAPASTAAATDELEGRAPLTPSLIAVRDALVRHGEPSDSGRPGPVIWLCGNASRGEKQAIVASASSASAAAKSAVQSGFASDSPVMIMPAEAVQREASVAAAAAGTSAAVADLTGRLRRVRREVLLRGCPVLLVETGTEAGDGGAFPRQGAAADSGADGASSAAASGRALETMLRSLVREFAGDTDPQGTTAAVMPVALAPPRIVITAREPVMLASTATATLLLTAARPSGAEQRDLWISQTHGKSALPEGGDRSAGFLDRLTGQFDLSGDEICAAASTAAIAATPDGSRPVTDATKALWQACRVQVRRRMDGLAERLPTEVDWEDLVLPPAQKEALAQIIAQVRRRVTVYERWGFAARSGGRGLGIAALFAGPSGTGKTLAAQAIASALELDLYRVDLASLVSKYIGETEKNLACLFDAAEPGGAILLFDEADALFGKRSEVKDSHDRYANIEVSYLLQRLESYRGLAVLTTNLRSSIDTAFLRRLRFVVAFPFPSEAERAQIWQRVFPPQVPTQGLVPERLAQLNVTGGSIRNIALAAAFLAADANEPVQMSHLRRAAHGECAKLERTLTDAETAGWNS